ncbi:hypothetical protein M3G03_10085 [Aestuariimicrobium sp. p3-SID1156]|uniref:hypothetical protein n=1 Tax=Aestuariimicrobium sp. p3-SID1156 TaxID=2916038 RepID=UPI00223B56A9|nr:hypothetical protein [Aestuariimicrobium sp. p3-SID1156]MCT1459879.1 hypothetical protein [Aestuariimicrobium sp. p3-SID1156]
MSQPHDALGPGGRELWSQISDAHDLDANQRVLLLEACRAKDRCDLLTAAMAPLDPMEWGKLADQANSTANYLKQILAAMRLPDEAGKRPQQRGGARGAYVAGGKTSAATKAAARWGS